ncbi:MAG: hypothetical protein K2Q01_04915, partial [Rickettsiales bacterium]|nr:hypothetical protein [Rickettsiales bacterium]
FSRGEGPDEKTNLNVSVNIPNVMFDESLKEKAKDTLKNWDATKPWQWDSDYELAKALNTDVAAATNGVDGFNTALLGSPVFKVDDTKKAMAASVMSYAISDVRVGDLGVAFTLQRPMEKDVDHKPELEKVAAAINEPAHNTEIKEVLTQRVVKNTEIKMKADGKSDAEIQTQLAKVKADMAKLVITANIDTDWNNGVRISLRSPEQAKERASKPSDWVDCDNGVALRAGNPLSELDNKETDKNPHPALQKSLARAIFYDKNKQVRPEMINFMGSMDMKAALAKEFHRLKQTAPEKTAAFDKILASEMFKIHSVDQKQPDSGRPNASMEIAAGKNDVVHITMPIARKDLEATFKAMSGQVVEAAPASSPAPVPAVATAGPDAMVADQVIQAAGASASSFAASVGKNATVPSAIAAAGAKTAVERLQDAGKPQLGLGA